MTDPYDRPEHEARYTICPDCGEDLQWHECGASPSERTLRIRQLNDAARKRLANGTITSGTVMLDEDYDRNTQQPRLLRMHELGHALGFNHVESLRSVMNPTVGTEPTDFDRRTARIAFRHIAPADRPAPTILARN